jgi:hypothetical protein
MLTALTMLATLVAQEPTLLLRQCDVAIGQVRSCSAVSFNGTAVVEHDGLLRSCEIVNGRVTSCGGSFQGEVPIKHEGKIRKCKITNGRVFSCEAVGYSGTVVLRAKAS